MDEGTHGLAVVKSHGGVAIVQSEEDAIVPHMPASAANAVEADHVIPASQMAGVIASLVGKPQRVRGHARSSAKARRRSAADPPPPQDLTEVPTVFTCPDCGGALWELEDHGTLRYRCHVGHGITSEGLARAKVDGVEESLWRAVRALAEHAELRRRMASRARKGRLAGLASGWETEAARSERNADAIRQLLVPGEERRDLGARAARPAKQSAQRG